MGEIHLLAAGSKRARKAARKGKVVEVGGPSFLIGEMKVGLVKNNTKFNERRLHD